jgi:hypothetical protein
MFRRSQVAEEAIKLWADINSLKILNSLLFGLVLMIFATSIRLWMGDPVQLYSLSSFFLGAIVGFITPLNPLPSISAFVFAFFGGYLCGIGCLILIWMGMAPGLLDRSHVLDAAIAFPMPAGFVAGFAQKDIDRIVKSLVDRCIVYRWIRYALGTVFVVGTLFAAAAWVMIELS